MVKRVCWLVFARAGSKRLPHKCYKHINKLTTIEHIVSNLGRCGIDSKDVILCTSTDQESDKLIEIAKTLKIRFVRGSEKYPLKRILVAEDILKDYRKTVRICGDSPLYEPQLAVKSIACDKDNELDFITNTRLKNFPSGQSVEVYKTKSMLSLIKANKDVQEEEHMSKIYMHKNAIEWRVGDISSVQRIPAEFNVKLTLDTDSDYKFLTELSNQNRWEKFNNFYSDLDVGVKI